MAEILVSPVGGDVYRVEVKDGSGSTTHEVTATPDVVERYAAGFEPAALIEGSFRFLLEREPKEAILRTFDLPVIERYFGDFPMAIRNYLP